MRLLYVAQDYYPFLERGGRPWKVAAMAKELAARGHRVEVLTADLGLDAAFRALGVPFDRHEARASWGSTHTHDGVTAHYLDVAFAYRATALSPKVLRFCRARLGDFDLVHVFGVYDLLGAPVSWLARRRGIPYVVEPMGMIVPIVRSIRKKHVYHALLGRRMLDGAARVVATSEQERGELLTRGIAAEKILLRRNGIDIEPYAELPPRGAFRRELGLAEDDFLVLFVGRISRKKGLHLLLRAVATLPSKVHVAIVGPDDGDGSLQELRADAARLGLDDRVRFEGPRFGEAKIQAMRDADLFALPSRNENFGNAVVEAIACGLPALVTSECGVAPLVDGRAGIVVAYSEEALAGGLRAALGDAARLSRLAGAGPGIARELSWAEPIDAMLAAYDEATAAGSP
jgi:glycosyltransferase involved in cell wall biosynthesis